MMMISKRDARRLAKAPVPPVAEQRNAVGPAIARLAQWLRRNERKNSSRKNVVSVAQPAGR